MLGLALVLSGLPATEAQAAPSPDEPLTLSASSGTYLPLNTGLSLLRDPDHRLSLQDIQELPDSAFTPLVRNLSLGFTTDAVWLKLSLRRTADGPQTWWLEMNQPLLRDVRLYAAPSGDDLRAIQQEDSGDSGEIYRLPGYRRSLFELTLPSEQTQTFYLRVASQTALSSDIGVWRPEALLRSSTQTSFFWGAMFGAYALVILFYGVFWLWTRERVHGIYTIYVLLTFLAALFTGNWPAQLWPWAGSTATVLLLGVWISLSLPAGLLFTLVFIQHDRPLSRLERALVALACMLALASMALVIGNHYHVAMPAIQSVSMMTIVLLMIWALMEYKRGNKAARLYVFAFSFFYIGVAWRYVRNIGWIEPNFWNDHSYQLGAFVHMLLLSVGIFASYNQLRREKEQAESRANAESSMRLMQRDFLAMVSHELRTPLTIVGASVDNLLDEPALTGQARQRVEKIQRASDRMHLLMENYLASERLLMEKEQQAMVWASCDLVQLCGQIREEMADQDGTSLVLHMPSSLKIMCDKELVRIAIANLVTNAYRHSPPQAAVELSLAVADGKVDICVRDQGEGIPANDLAHLFKRFFRGQNALNRPGTGLGLYLVQGIAARHGGSVGVRNLPERGCEFCLKLPLQGHINA